MPQINIDTILSDPMMLIASSLLIIGSLLFIMSLAMAILAKQRKEDFIIPPIIDQEKEGFISSPNETTLKQSEWLKNTGRSSEVSPVSVQKPLETPVSPISIPTQEPIPPSVVASSELPSVSPKSSPRSSLESMERTMVMPAGVSEVQAQIEIAITQLRTLNKKVNAHEVQLEMLSKNLTTGTGPGKTPTDLTDIQTKIQKLAEHVLALEKDLTLLKQGKVGSSTPPSPPQGRPPVMPL